MRMSAAANGEFHDSCQRGPTSTPNVLQAVRHGRGSLEPPWPRPLADFPILSADFRCQRVKRTHQRAGAALSFRALRR